jgi:tellurite methyltransferase
MTTSPLDEPFWEAAYRDAGAAPFGPPSEEVVRLAARLPAGAAVLDLGCGDGRNAIVFLENGADVDAVDRSEAGIRKLETRARAAGHIVASSPQAGPGAGGDAGRLNAWVQDLATFVFPRDYDAVIAHGVLHLLPPPLRDRLLADMQAHTAPGGWNVVTVFTDRLPSPPDLAPHTHGLFAEGELRDRYQGWKIEEWRAYTLQDEHPGGVRHSHAVNKIVARKR